MNALFDFIQRAQMVRLLLLLIHTLVVTLSQQIHLHTRVEALDNLLILCQDATSRELGHVVTLFKVLIGWHKVHLADGLAHSDIVTLLQCGRR